MDASSVFFSATGISDVITANSRLQRYFEKLRNAGVTVGGKTGTAQVSSSSTDNAIFAAYADQNGKKLVSVCVIEHGSSGPYAGYTVSELMNSYYLGEAD
jgi:cell division protein FtsI/penicillin-binding protein 2